MRRIGASVLVVCLLFPSSYAFANLLHKLRDFREQKKIGSGAPDSDTISAGLKEALSLGAKNGVTSVSKPDGYFGNKLIRIAMPEKMKKMERLMRKVGLHKEADRFILSMNRAAEKAAPLALGFFIEAVKDMTIPDALGILRGRDTAATEFLQSRTYDGIYTAFKPAVSSAMNEVRVTHAFKEFMDKADSVPFLKKESVDLDHYVTSKALDGLFIAVGQEERKIRKDPQARTSELLRKVFSE